MELVSEPEDVVVLGSAVALVVSALGCCDASLAPETWWFRAVFWLALGPEAVLALGSCSLVSGGRPF